MQMNFDSSAVSALGRTLDHAMGSLRSRGMWRREAIEQAVVGFTGVYARVFTAACDVELRDRVRLVAELCELCAQLREVKYRGRKEQERRDRLAAWRERERERDRVWPDGDFFQWMREVESRIVDPMPSDEPIHPRPIFAAFRASSRPRSGGGSPSGGRSSADPVRLQVFASGLRVSEMTLEQELSRVKDAWVRFTATCSWVPIESATFLVGFERYLAENRAESEWLQRVATAFARAGGGSLSNLVLETLATTETPKPLWALFVPGLKPAEVARLYETLGLTEADVRELPLETQVVFANLDGLPAWARDIASRAMVAAAVEDPRAVFRLMGLRRETEIGLRKFEEQVRELQEGLAQADDLAKKLPGGPGDQVAQLLGFEIHDGVLVSAVCLGNLDTASNVTVNVPGAETTMEDTDQKVRAANEIVQAARREDKLASFAVVTWVGYHAPGLLEVPSTARARSGGVELAGFIDGAFESRGGRPPGSFTVAAHSYGSTTAAEALLLTENRVTSFVSYGSAGIRNGTAEMLNTEAMYTTTGEKDRMADLGNNFSLSTTAPHHIDGITEFSAEAGKDTLGVTGHDMYPDDDPDKVGYLSAGSNSLKHIAAIVAKGRP